MFATKAVWVVKDVEGPKGGRLWPSGKYVPQTRGEPEESVSKWIQSGGSIENEDIVLFFTIGGSFRCGPSCQAMTRISQARHISLVLKIGLCECPDAYIAVVS